MTTDQYDQRIREFLPLFDACKDDHERSLLSATIREGVTFEEFTEGFGPGPFSINDLVMVDVAKSMKPLRTRL